MCFFSGRESHRSMEGARGSERSRDPAAAVGGCHQPDRRGECSKLARETAVEETVDVW